MEGYVGIETALNHGALFGMGQGKVWFFAAMSFVAIGGVFFWLTKYRAIEDWMLTVILGLVSAEYLAISMIGSASGADLKRLPFEIGFGSAMTTTPTSGQILTLRTACLFAVLGCCSGIR